MHNGKKNNHRKIILPPQHGLILPKYEYGEIVDLTQPIDAHFGEDLFFDYSTGDELKLPEDVTTRHFLCLGGTGEGKSSLMNLRCRNFLLNHRGFALLDANNSTARELFAWIAYHREELGLDACQVFLFDPDRCLCSIDPRRIQFDSSHPLANTKVGMDALRESLVRDLVQIVMVKRGETEEDQQLQKRRQRTLRAAFYGLTTPIDSSGNYLPFESIFDVVDPRSPQHDECYRQIQTGIPRRHRVFLDSLRELRKRAPQQIDNFIESTLTQLDAVLTPLVLAVLDSQRPSIPIETIIQHDGVLLVCGGKTDYVHQDVGLFFMKCFLKMLTNALRRIPEHQRSDHPFYVEIDEAHNLIDDDLLIYLKEARKYRFSCGLYTQEIEGLKK